MNNSRRSILSRILAVLAAVTAAGCSLASPAHPHDDEWCDECGAGFVAEVRVPSQQFFEALDAHGHTIDPLQLRCATCRQRYDSDGYCVRCRMGFVDQQAYLSRLAYLAASERRGQLAAGESEEIDREAARLEASVELIPRCEVCAMASFFRGSCTQCGIDYASDRPRR